MRHEHLAGAVDGELHRDDALDDDVLDRLHQVAGVDVVGTEVFEEGAQRPLVALNNEENQECFRRFIGM